LAKLPNHRLVKVHRSYNVGEAAGRLGVHKNTVRRWINETLPTVGWRGETLILGWELRSFLESRRLAAKRPCPPGHLFCLKCREPRRPAGQMGEYAAVTATSGNLTALCPECLTAMHRRVREADLARFWAELEVTRTQPPPHLNGRPKPSLNGDSR
jgi:hypothetical protein